MAVLKEKLRAALQARSGNRALRFAYKLWQLRRHSAAARASPRQALRFVLRGREVSNFTYENQNEDEIPSVVGSALGLPESAVRETMAELEADEELRAMLTERLRANPLREDEPRYGYRRISYCVVRLLRPALIAECGTHDGLGASLMLRALERNAGEGYEGVLRTFDITADAGWLIPDPLRSRLELTIGDVFEHLGPALRGGGADFFIEDFGHSFPGKEELIETALAARAGGDLAVLTECDDNPALALIAERTGGRYSHFREQPADHWWAGHDWGLALLRAGSQPPAAGP